MVQYYKMRIWQHPQVAYAYADPREEGLGAGGGRLALWTGHIMPLEETTRRATAALSWDGGVLRVLPVLSAGFLTPSLL